MNNYAYVGGNPIARTDPSGKIWYIVVPVVIGAAAGAIDAYAYDIGKCPDDPVNWWDIGSGALVGGIGGLYAGLGLGAGAGAAAIVAANNGIGLAGVGGAVAGWGFGRVQNAAGKAGCTCNSK